MPNVDVTLKSGEAKTLTFTVTDTDGAAVDLSEAVLEFAVKADISKDTTVITKGDVDFDKSLAVDGVVSINLSVVNTTRIGRFYGELRIEFSDTSIDKSQTLLMVFEQAVTE